MTKKEAQSWQHLQDTLIMRKHMVKSFQGNLKSVSICSIVILAASLMELVPCVADSSAQKENPLRVGLISLSTAETCWTETEEYNTALRNGHEVRQQINKLVPTHSSECVFEAPNGVYEHFCESCMSLPKSTVEQLARLEEREAIQLGNAKAIKLGAVRKAAELVRKKEHLDLLVDQSSGIVAGLTNLITGRRTDGYFNLKCKDYTDDVCREVKEAQSGVQQK